MNFNPTVAPDHKRAILRALDFADNGRGASEDDFRTRSGVETSNFGRGLLQMSNEGLVKEWGKSKWYGPGWTLTDAGRAFLAAPAAVEASESADVVAGETAAKAAPQTCLALMIRPPMALVPLRTVTRYHYLLMALVPHGCYPSDAPGFRCAPVFAPAPF